MTSSLALNCSFICKGPANNTAEFMFQLDISNASNCCIQCQYHQYHHLIELWLGRTDRQDSRLNDVTKTSCPDGTHFISRYDVHRNITQFITKWRHCLICIDMLMKLALYLSLMPSYRNNGEPSTPSMCLRLFLYNQNTLFIFGVLTTIHSYYF